MTVSPIDNVLCLLSQVQKRQSGQYSALCPAHEDKKPSLSLRETPEGAVLIHCFGGCSVNEITTALGLDMTDLFPRNELSGYEPKKIAHLLTPLQALELLDEEANFVAIACAGLANGVLLIGEDLQRVLKASGRIGWLRKACMRSSHA